MAMLEQPGVRLPGQRRFCERQARSEFIHVPKALIKELEGFKG